MSSSSSKPALMAPTSSAEELDRQQPLAGASVVKRKRTKRPRHHDHRPASSSESTTTEEEDMAHCLILLAQGGGAVVDSKPSSPQPPAVMVVKSGERYTSRKYTEAATTEDGVKAGFYVYECRTCNKCFPTFQALGGHRASHKKPRFLLTADDDIDISKQPPPPPPEVTTALSLNNSSHVMAPAAGSKLRVHECSICGAEFSSGQALGGHMRRHRPLNAPTTTKKEGTINLDLDLNLPAPSDEEASAAVSSLPAVVLGLGQFNDGNKAGLVLTASALVDCHY